MTKLKQKKLFQSKEYKILDSELYIKIKKPSEHNEWHCSFEELGLKKLYKKQPSTIKNIIAIICLFIAATATFTFIFFPDQMEQGAFLVNLVCWGFLGVLFIVIPTKNEIYLYGGSQDVSFFRNVPDEQTVDAFVDELIHKTKQHLRNKFARVDKDLNKDFQIGNFNWLKNIDVITEQEYEELKEEVNRQQLL